MKRPTYLKRVGTASEPWWAYGVKAGDLGGLIYGEHNLAQGGDCGVGGEAKVYGEAVVSGRALVMGRATLL